MKQNPSLRSRFPLFRRLRAACLPLLLGAPLMSSLIAAPVVEVNFSGDTLGAPPSTTGVRPPSGAVIEKPFSVTNFAGLFTVANDYSSQGTVLEGRSVVMRVDRSEAGKALGGSMNIMGNLADFSAGQDFSIKADLLFNGSFGNLASSGLSISLYNNTFDYTGNQAQIVFYENNRLALYSNNAPKVVYNVWQSDELIALEIRMLYSEGKGEILVNGSLAGDFVLNAKAPGGINGIQFHNASDNSYYEVAIANIRAEAIPEAGSVVMVLSGTALIGLAGRYRKLIRTH